MRKNEKITALYERPVSYTHLDVYKRQVLSGKSRSVIRGIGRETLQPLQKEVSPMKTKTPKKRGVER